MNKPTVQILPQTQGHTLCISYSGIVRADEYLEKVQPAAHRIKELQDGFRLLIYYTPDYKGWEPEAAALNFKNINDLNPQADRLAYVNPPERKVLQVSLQKFMWPGEVRLFDEAELEDALRWIGEE